MDIYKYAESIDWLADYYDITTGLTYHIQEAGRAKKLFGIDLPIKVTDSDGNLVGYVKKE